MVFQCLNLFSFEKMTTSLHGGGKCRSTYKKLSGLWLNGCCRVSKLSCEKSMEDPYCAHVKLEVKRIQNSHFYPIIRAYNSLARMNLEIHSILKLYSVQYCSLLAKV
jgi:hypothetical protein